MKKRILITGGAGFLGSHLAERLLNEGNEVIVADNFFTGNKRNIVHLLDNPYFELIRHDITLPLHIEADEIYNLACPASPIHYQFDPVQTIKTNVVGSINMLGLARRLKVKILQASTSEVYGDPEIHPQPETYRGNVNPIGPRACYDEGKRSAETLFFDYHRQHGVDIKVVRIFNTYGPRMHPDDGRVVSNFIVQALQGEDITVYGEGQQTRSFCYVDDLVDAMVRMMNSPDGFQGPVNIGNPGEFTILELAQKVIELTGSKSDIIYKPLPQDDPMQRKPNIDLAREQLGWEPTVDLKAGLQKTIEYFDTLLREEGKGDGWSQTPRGDIREPYMGSHSSASKQSTGTEYSSKKPGSFGTLRPPGADQRPGAPGTPQNPAEPEAADTAKKDSTQDSGDDTGPRKPKTTFRPQQLF